MKNFFRAVWQFCSYLFWPRWGGKSNNSTMSVNDHQNENNRIYALHCEVLDAIYEAFNMMSKKIIMLLFCLSEGLPFFLGLKK